MFIIIIHHNYSAQAKIFDLFIGIKASHRIQNYVEHKKRSLFVLFEVLQTKCK